MLSTSIRFGRVVVKMYCGERHKARVLLLKVIVTSQYVCPLTMICVLVCVTRWRVCDIALVSFKLADDIVLCGRYSFKVCL